MIVVVVLLLLCFLMVVGAVICAGAVLRMWADIEKATLASRPPPMVDLLVC